AASATAHPDAATSGTPASGSSDEAPSTAAATRQAPERFAHPGRTLRTLAGPVRRAVSPRAARSPLPGAGAPLGADRSGGEVRAAGITHAAAPPARALPEVRRSTITSATPAATVRGAESRGGASPVTDRPSRAAAGNSVTNAPAAS